MNKAEFLSALKARLAVLEPSEQQDILDEYAYHIDMRVAGGLTEEEADRDFGDMDQLVRLIYEAYHVNPDYCPPAAQAGTAPVSAPEPVPDLPDPEEDDDEEQPSRLIRFLAPIDKFFCTLWANLKHGFCAVGQWFAQLGHKIAGWFRRKPGLETAELCPAPETGTALPGSGAEQEGQEEQTGSGFGTRFLTCCKAVLRTVWNGFLLFCALPFAAAGVLGLIVLGFAVVMLAQGYPLAGPLLVLVGGLLCCGAILALGTNLIWRRPEPEEEECSEEVEIDEEEND